MQERARISEKSRFDTNGIEPLHSYRRLDESSSSRLPKVIRICPECGREDVFYRYQRTKRCHRCRAKSKEEKDYGNR